MEFIIDDTPRPAKRPRRVQQNASPVRLCEHYLFSCNYYQEENSFHACFFAPYSSIQLGMDLADLSPACRQGFSRPLFAGSGP